eukprot:6191651-Pleurochrysis_carterae.AAC.4
MLPVATTVVVRATVATVMAVALESASQRVPPPGCPRQTPHPARCLRTASRAGRESRSGCVGGMRCSAIVR